MTSLFLALRWAVAIIWMLAGVAKIGKSTELTSALESYRIIPKPLIGIVAKSLPPAELLLGAFLAGGVLPVISGMLAAAAFAVFAAAIGWNLLHHRQFYCGCGISPTTPISWRLVGRNVVFVVGAATVAAGPSGGLAIVRGSASLGHSPGAAQLIAVPMIVILLVVAFRLLAVTFASQPGAVERLRSPDNASAKPLLSDSRLLSIDQVPAS